MITKFHCTYLAIVLLSACSLVANSIATDTVPAAENEEQTILSLEQGWAHAYVADDAAYLDMVMNPAYVQTNVRGEVSTKAEEVGEVRDHMIHYEKFESSDLKVRIYGNAAVVTGQTWIKATVKKSGRAIDASVRFTDTFIKQNGKWQAVASQTTLLPNKP